MKEKPLLIWDVDDCLNRQLRIFFETTGKELTGGTVYEDIRNNPPYPELGCSKEEYLDALDRCRREFVYTSSPGDEVMEFFREYGNSFRAVTLSAVPISLAPLASSWILRHFGAWIQCTLFVPSPRPSEKICSYSFSSKLEAVQQLGGILIDDMPRNVLPVLEAGCKAYFFPAPWNENRDMKIKDFLHQLANELDLKK